MNAVNKLYSELLERIAMTSGELKDVTDAIKSSQGILTKSKAGYSENRRPVPEDNFMIWKQDKCRVMKEEKQKQARKKITIEKVYGVNRIIFCILFHLHSYIFQEYFVHIAIVF